MAAQADAPTPFRRLTYFVRRLLRHAHFTKQAKTMSQRKRQTRKRTTAPASASSALGGIVHPHAAGIDVGAKELVAAIAPGSLEGPPVRTFSAFTEGLHALRDWLLAAGTKTVAMESTGNYWLCVCALLEDAGIEVCLVNARHVKGVPGKKTDV
ncbi:MAG: transposase, partial [Chthoniobacteraceae bacterium]